MKTPVISDSRFTCTDSHVHKCKSKKRNVTKPDQDFKLFEILLYSHKML